jgi:molybdopterin-guanine dinucleotide biosynthesis protein
VIIEGYKRGAFPKIEVIRADREPTLIPKLEGRIACVTDVPDLACDGPTFEPDAVEAIADFIVAGFLTGEVGGRSNG